MHYTKRIIENYPNPQNAGKTADYYRRQGRPSEDDIRRRCDLREAGCAGCAAHSPA